jgi:hypothetical protein
MDIDFPVAAVYDSHRLGVRFFVRVDRLPRMCLVSDEALNDHFGGDSAKNDADRVALFVAHRPRFEGIVRAYIGGGHEGDILLTTDDFA